MFKKIIPVILTGLLLTSCASFNQWADEYVDGIVADQMARNCETTFVYNKYGQTLGDVMVCDDGVTINTNDNLFDYGSMWD